MRKKILRHRLLVTGCWLLVISLTGCGTVTGLHKRNREQAATIISLSNEIERLSTEVTRLAEAEGGLARAKSELERRLKKEIAKGKLEVEMGERGLVVTMVAEVMFDPGKTVIKDPAMNTLTKIASVLNSRDVRENLVFVEGHTDNVPIKYSGFKSNWELSTARATEILHFLIGNCNVKPERLSATGYGKYRPRDTNETEEGRTRNRRVQIIISLRKLAEVTAKKEPKYVK